jgi:TRAP-type C4-dicarboxylate transport system permease small subunit
MKHPARRRAATAKTVRPTTEIAAPPAGDRGQGALDLFTDGLEAIAIIAFIVMMGATLLQVAGRYLEISMDWTEELARLLFLAAIMLGIAIAIRRREHIVVDVLYLKMSPGVRAAFDVLFDLGILLLLGIWLRGAWWLMQLNSGTTFVMLPWIEVAYLYAVEAAAIALMIIYVIADSVRRAKLVMKAASS